MATFCITLKYGPYEVGGIVEHRTERLVNLRERLENDDYTVILKKWSHYDRLGIFFDNNETAIFTCRLTFLQYPNVLDPVSERMYLAISKAIRKSNLLSIEEVPFKRPQVENVEQKRSRMLSMFHLMLVDDKRKRKSEAKEK